MTVPPSSSDYDVFVSGTTAESASIEALVGTLTNKGLRVARREMPRDADGGVDEVVDRLGRSKLLLALYSPGYLAEAHTQIELSAAWFAGQREGVGPQRIVTLSPGDDHEHIYPSDLRGGVSARIPTPKNTKGLGAAARAVRERLESVTGTMGRVHSLARPPWHGIAPDPFLRFVGRFPMMWAMHAELARGPVAVETNAPATINLHGLAGLGKSLLAREYAVRFGTAYPGGVFWLRAYGAEDPVSGLGTEERLAERDRQIREFAGALGVIIANRGPAEIRMALGDALGRRQRRCLWIVDDLPPGLGESGIRDWIGPHPLADTIVTSRERQPRTLVRPLELSPLTPPEAVRLLAGDSDAGSDQDREAAEAMTEALGWHALGVNVLGATMAAANTRPRPSSVAQVATAAEQLDDRVVSDLETVVPAGCERTIGSAIVSALNDLSEEGRDFMRVASILAPAPILPTVLRAIWGIVHDLDGDRARDVIDRGWDEADRRGLTDTCGGPGRERTVHPLISRIVRLVDPVPARLDTIRAAAVNALRDQLPSKYDPSAYAAVEHEISHARELVRRPTTIAESELLGRVARYDLVRGAYESAAGLFRRQSEAYQDIHGDGHPETARALGNLAGVMFLTGDVAQARRLHERALEIRRETLGDEHADTMASMNNLATLLGVEGQLDRARSLQEEALEIRRRVLGPGHTDTLTAMGNLAATLDAQGELDGVRDLQQEVLSVQVRRLGPEHPQATTAAWNLYATLSRLRDERAAAEVLNQHLTWLLEKEPSALAADQQSIRTLLTEHRQV